jgi:glycosyltransferase involved in cell wall biosynthesis
VDVVHVSPTFYSADSVVGGGEKYVDYMIRALDAAARAVSRELSSSMLAVGSEPAVHILPGGTRLVLVEGSPWDPRSLDASALRARLEPPDVVVVHQCLSAFGLFVASHAKALGKTVVGMDHGGGEHPLAQHTPEIGRVFDLFVAQSRFAAASFHDLDGPVEVVPGPVDTTVYTPDRAKTREPDLVIALGRALPHKGFDTVIDALPAGLRLAILGTPSDASYWDYLQERAAAARGEVRFLTNLSDEQVKDLLQRAGLMVHASTHLDYRGHYYPKPELLGLAPLEAMACGTPALVSSAGALVELHELDGCRGFMLGAELDALLVEHTRGALTWPDQDAIHDSVATRYGTDVFGRKLLTVLEMLVAA